MEIMTDRKKQPDKRNSFFTKYFGSNLIYSLIIEHVGSIETISQLFEQIVNVDRLD